MALEITDILKTNIVLVGINLLNSQERVLSFGEQVGSEVVSETFLVPPGLEQGDALPRILRIPKDRISMQCAPGRSMVEKEYPERDHLERLSDIANYAIQNSELDEDLLTSFGFNIDMVFELPPAETAYRFLAGLLFASSPRPVDEWTNIGGSGTLTYDDGDNQWTITAEPRFGDRESSKVFTSLNLHINNRRVPSRDEMLGLLRSTWDNAHALQTWGEEK